MGELVRNRFAAAGKDQKDCHLCGVQVLESKVDGIEAGDFVNFVLLEKGDAIAQEDLVVVIGPNGEAAVAKGPARGAVGRVVLAWRSFEVV